MKITITGLDDEKIFLSNNELDNYNYIELKVGDDVIMVDVVELLSAITAFMVIKKETNNE